MAIQTSDQEWERLAPMEDLVSSLERAVRGERVAVREIFDAVGDTSFLPVLMIPALLVVSPLSGIPGFSSICGLMIAFVAIQMIFRRPYLWIPSKVAGVKLDGEKTRGAINRLYGLARFLDRHATGHGAWVMRRPVRMTCVVACMICGLSMPFLELVPFSSSLLGLAVVFYAVSLLTRDALFMGLGLLVMCTALTLPFYALKTVLMS